MKKKWTIAIVVIVVIVGLVIIFFMPGLGGSFSHY